MTIASGILLWITGICQIVMMVKEAKRNRKIERDGIARARVEQARCIAEHHTRTPPRS